MVESIRQPAFPTLITLVILTALAIGLYGLIHWVGVITFNLSKVESVAICAMAMVAWASSIIGLMPVIVLGPKGVRPTVVGYFIGAGARVLICIVAAVVLIKAIHLPAEAVMITLVVMYLPMLFLESTCVCRYLWQKDGQVNGGSSPSVGAMLTREGLP